MEKAKNISAAIQEIKEAGFSYKPLPSELESQDVVASLRLGLGYEFEINTEEEIIKLRTNIEYNIEGYKESFLNFSNVITFKVINLVSALKEENGELLEIDNELMISLIAVCIGTTRGLLAANTKGTDWVKFPVPILDPKQVVKEMNKSAKK